MRFIRAAICGVGGLSLAFASSHVVHAQHYTFDARRVALGGVGGNESAVSEIAGEVAPYLTIGLPFGLIQVVPNLGVFDPDGPEFDPARALENATSPLHYVLGRSGHSQSQAFITGVVQRELSRDLNVYRGFRLPSEQFAQGLASPSWGKTFVQGPQTGTIHGFYVGVGPYFSVRAATEIDPRLVELLASTTDMYLPDATLTIDQASTGQMAVAITGGYRTRFPIPGRSTIPGNADGVYLAFNYHHIEGFRLYDFLMDANFKTDSAGLLSLTPDAAAIDIAHLTATRGHGKAIDVGGSVLADRWEFGGGVNGIGNRIDWRNIVRKRIVAASLIDGHEPIVTPPLSSDDRVRIELPLNFVANTTYRAERWTLLAEYTHGLQGNNLRSGVEYRFRWIELRGGARYSRDRWEPSAGLGLEVSPQFGVELAVFSNSANFERRRNIAIAASLRLARKRRL